MKLALLALLAIIISSSEALNDTLSFNGEPQYALKILTSDTVLDSGDHFRIQLFIIGAGDVDFSRISVTIPEYIVDGGKINLTSLVFPPVELNKKLDPTVEAIELLPSFYRVPQPVLYMLPAVDATNSFSGGRPMTIGESFYLVNGTYYAPFTVDFAVPKNATAGDREIYINLIYKYYDKWYQDSKTVKLHINHWYERWYWQNLLQFATLLGLVVLIATILSKLWNHILNK